MLNASNMVNVEELKQARKQGKLLHRESIIKGNLVPLAQTLIKHLDRQNSSHLILHMLSKPESPLNIQHLEAYYLLLKKDYENKGFKNRVTMRKAIREIPKKSIRYLNTSEEYLIPTLQQLEKANLIQEIKVKRRGKWARDTILKLAQLTITYPQISFFEQEKTENYDLQSILLLLENYIYAGELSCLTKKQVQELPNKLKELSVEELQAGIKELFYKLQIHLPALQMLDAVPIPDDFDRTRLMSSKEKELYLKGMKQYEEEMEKWKIRDLNKQESQK